VLKNGKTASGKLFTEGHPCVDGWSGETDQGLVFIAPNLVRSVEFGESTKE